MTALLPGSRLRLLINARSVAARDGVPLESVELEAAADVRPGGAEVAGRVEDALSDAVERMPPDEVGDPRDFRRALSILLSATERAVDRLGSGTEAGFTAGDARALEAVIRIDGTRPTLLVRDDAVDPDHPLAGDWAPIITATRDTLRDPVRAVGRIEPANATARNFFGSGWVVDAGAGLVLTNLHVLEAIWRRLPQCLEPTQRGFRVHGGVFVDFAGESGRLRTNRFRVVEAVPSGVDGPGYSRLDAAVLRIEPTNDGETEPPPAIPVEPDPDGPRGNTASFCVVGFAGPPRYTGGVHEGVDWTWLNNTLFGNRYGVKRLAPGVAHRPIGSFAEDPRQWVFGHDPTTLHGNSGSPMLAWLDPAPSGFGLHFAGASVDTNLAHAFSGCVPELRRLGVPLPDPSGG